MKKSIITVFAAIALASCGGNGAQAPQQTAATAEGDKAVTAEFINQKVQELVKYIPDHGIIKDSEKFITPEFYAMLKKAFDLPAQDTEGIDESREFLFYFIEGNGDCAAYSDDAEQAYKNHSFANFKTTIDGDVATSEFDYVHGAADQSDHHKIVLKKVDGNWLIDNWDDSQNKVKNYLDNYKK
jgi:hypothetical protein